MMVYDTSGSSGNDVSAMLLSGATHTNALAHTRTEMGQIEIELLLSIVSDTVIGF